MYGQEAQAGEWGTGGALSRRPPGLCIYHLKGSVVVADCGRGVEKGGFQILLDVADFGCVLPHTVKHKADMLAV